MQAILNRTSRPDLKWKVVAYLEETHSSIRLKSTYDGIKHAYAGYTQSIEFHPMNGLILKDKPYPLWYFEDTARVYYSLDGVMPDESSAPVGPEVIVKGPATATYKRLTNRSQYDKTVTGRFTAGESLQPVSKPTNLTPGRWHYSYYEIDKDKPANLHTLKPLPEGIFNKNISAASIPRKITMH